MSYSLVINIWLPAKSTTVLSADATIRSLVRAGKSKVDFLRAEAFTRPNESLGSINPSTRDDLEISRFLEDYLGEERSVVVEAGFPLFDENELVVLPCILRFYGKNYGHYHQRRFGDIEIAFENVASFAGLGEGRMLARFDKARNFGLVLDFTKCLITSVDVHHMMISTSDTECNPLCAHMVYHQHIEDFLNDLKSIARLHINGGIYRFEGTAGFSPLRVTKQYGHLRREKGNDYLEDFLNKVDGLAEYCYKYHTSFQLIDSEIEGVLSSASGVIVDSGPNGTMVICEYGPSSYIDNVYWDLFLALSTREPQEKRQSTD